MPTCTFCGFGLYHAINASLQVSRAGVYDDARFPGRVIMMLNRHHEQIETLDPGELAKFWEVAIKVGLAVKRVTGASRINYAVLGNAEPHLHVHIIPRHPSQEQLPTRSPWSDPRPHEELPLEEIMKLQEKLGAILST